MNETLAAASEQRQRTRRRLRLGVRIGTFLAFATLILAAVAAYYGISRASGASATSLAELGAYLSGAVGSLLTFVSAMFIYVAFLGQREADLHRQDEIDRSERLHSTQRFESTFVALLKFHYDTARSLRTAGGQSASGSSGDLFRLAFEHLRKFYSEAGADAGDPGRRMATAYEKVYEKYGNDLGHYFRHLYNVVKLIDESGVANPQRYANVVRAQLSTYESLLLFYNCLHRKGRRKFRPLVEKYGLLESVSFEALLSNDDVRSYDLSAFGNRNSAGGPT